MIGMPRRLLSRVEAAAYCGLSPRGFDEWVKVGRLPSSIIGTKRYDLKAIDAALDRMSGLTQTDGPDDFETWVKKHARAT
jgi:hypothetical protein